ncbi:MAG: hypothetical protein LH650_00165 [Chloroflexi bacterium]|nr:hypothetical protein [Chloroflexota bacterium]
MTDHLPTVPVEWADELETRIARARAEILADIIRGVVPADVATFADLHDNVDGNDFGGLCEEPFYCQIRGDEDDPSEASWAFAVVLQDTIDRWLRAGRPA